MGGGGGGGKFGGTTGGGVKLHESKKSDAMQAVKTLPATQQKAAKRFVKRSSSRYSDFSAKQLPNENVLLKSENPGRVTGSKAVYYKEVGPDGKTVRVYKETYVPDGKLIHTKEKKVKK